MDEHQPAQPATDSQPGQPARRGRGPGRPFTKNDPRLRQNREPGAPVEGSDASLYEDMRHARTRPRSEDRTEGQRDCRRWKQNDSKGFLARYAYLEKAALAAGGRPRPGDPA